VRKNDDGNRNPPAAASKEAKGMRKMPFLLVFEWRGWLITIIRRRRKKA
jgi:hypothetical protein